MSSNRNRDTIAAMLSSAPSLAPVPDEASGTSTNTSSTRDLLEPDPIVYEATVEPVRPEHLAAVIDPAADELDDTDLDTFDFDTSTPLVKPRRRKQVAYQTMRLRSTAWRACYDSWLRAKREDVLLSFTEFSTMVVRRGLEALKEDRERGE